jgi:thiamine-phosphate diphosphorylase
MSRVPRLHLVSSSRVGPIELFPEVARAAAVGGVEAVHIREPDLSDEQVIKLANATKDAIAETSALLFINRRPDIAIEVGAQGLHLSERQIESVSEIRNGLPPSLLLGASIHSLEHAQEADRSGVDYLFCGHIFETGSKPGAPGRGIAFLQDVCESVEAPVIAIGGITHQRVGDVVRSGAYGIAVISEILAAADPRDAASRLLEELNNARRA